AEEVVLSRLMGAAPLVAEVHGRPQALHEGCASGAEAIEAARAQQRFQHPPVDLLQIEPPTQILQRRERTARAALDDQRLDRALAHTAPRAAAVAAARLAARRELAGRGVYLPWQRRESHVAALLDERLQLGGVIHSG